ncbi:MAG: hypothetical protein AAFW74_09730, partial [Pseudomonadota bacterium]
MTDTTASDDLFFAETGLEREAALRLTEDALVNSDDVKTGGSELAVVKHKVFGLAILQEQFTVIAVDQRVFGQPQCSFAL